MRIYPEIESWNEFYPSEIFILAEDSDQEDADFIVYKKANIGATIYVGAADSDTYILKKIGDIEVPSDFDSNTILVGRVNRV